MNLIRFALLATKRRALRVTSLLALPLFFLASAAPAAASDPTGAVVVYGKADRSHRKAVAAAVEEALRDAGWSLERRFSSREADTVVRCFAADKPGLCIAATAASREVERVVAVQVDPERGRGRNATLRLSGQLATAGTPEVVLQLRFCSPCNRDELAAAAQDLVRLLLDSSEVRAATTKIELRVKPAGVVVSLDGKLIGGDSKELATVAGPHTLLFELDGYARQTRSIEVKEGKTEVVEVELVPAAGITVATAPGKQAIGVLRPAPLPDSSDPADPAAAAGPDGPQTGQSPFEQPRERGRRWVPYTLMAVGGLALIGGGVLVAIDEDLNSSPTAKQPETYMNTASLGVGMMIGGALAGAVGGVLLFNAGDKPRRRGPASAAIVPTQSGALVGVGGTF
jgi:PEGA domain